MKKQSSGACSGIKRPFKLEEIWRIRALGGDEHFADLFRRVALGKSSPVRLLEFLDRQ